MIDAITKTREHNYNILKPCREAKHKLIEKSDIYFTDEFIIISLI
jgi:hypothetical protein